MLDALPGASSPPFAIRPHFLVRIAALPTEAVDVLGSATLLDACQRVVSADDAITVATERASDLLYGAIAAASDDAVRALLLAARRRIRHHKAIAAPILAQIETIDTAAGQSLTAHRDAIADRTLARDAFAQEYEAVLAASRDHLRRVVRDPLLQHGLVASSATLVDSTARYLSARRIGAREAQIERGLLRYLTRAARKATPFATFCAIAEGTLVPGAETAGLRVTLGARPSDAHRLVRINKRLRGSLWRVMTSVPAIRGTLPVARTPTLQETPAGELVYLAVLDGTERVQRVPGSAVPPALWSAVGDGAQSLAAVVARHEADAPETPPAAIAAFVDRLLEIGLLVFRSPDADQDVDWDRTVARTLAAIDDPHAQQIAGLLRTLRDGCEAAQHADPVEMARLTDVARTTIRRTLDEVPGGEWHRRLEPPMFVDLGAAEQATIARSTGVDAAITSLADFFSVAVQLGTERIAHANMRHLFEAIAGPDEALPLQAFHEAYARDQQSSAVRGAPSDVPDVVDAIQRAKRALIDLVLARVAACPTAAEIAITRADFDAILADVPRCPPFQSIGTFCQLVGVPDDEASVRVVMRQGSFSGGYGRLASRFLSLVSSGFGDAERAANRALTPEWIADISSDRNFNANLHPRLLDHSLPEPTGEHRAPHDALAVVDMDVVRHPRDAHALALRHRPTGTIVHAIDLGFLNAAVQPGLHRFLHRASPFLSSPVERGTFIGETLWPHRWQEAWREAPADHITYRPRCVYEGRVVLTRRRWDVPAAAFPQPRGDESAAEFFARVQQWRSAAGIPAQVYASALLAPGAMPGAVSDGARTDEAHDGDGVGDGELAPPDPAMPADESTRPSASVASSEEASRRAERLKPQFIDFSSPLLVDLFQRLPRGYSDFRVTLFECLPEQSGLPTIGGEHFAIEILLQADQPLTDDGTATRRRVPAIGS